MAPGVDSHTKKDRAVLLTPKAASDLWTIQDVEGKGKGVIASKDITPGTLLISEPPLITTECITSIETTERDLAQALRGLPKDTQRAFLLLHNNYKGEGSPLSNIIRSNGYPLGVNSDIGGVFEKTSRINHSCLPNAVHSWNPLLKEQTVYAIRPIAEGEEITVAYHFGGTSEVRKAVLQERFKFTCTCSVCSLPPDELATSDKHLIRAQELDSSIGNAATVRNDPSTVLKNCKLLLEIYKKENIHDDRLSRLYYDIFQVLNMHSDRARAAYWANRYCQAKKRTGGKDSVSYLEMKPFVKKPEKHGSFGLTGDWESSLKEVPKEKNGVEWERWLWRE